MQLSGQSVFLQGGREAHLATGDITLVDCGRPYDLMFREPVANLVMTVSRPQLLTYLACPEALSAVRLPGPGGPGALASRMLRELWRQPEELAAGCASPYLDRVVLDLLATAYSCLTNQSARTSPQILTRRISLLAYIERHLADADLSVEKIASAFRVTPRCIYRLFEGEGETLAKYIKRRRLEESARALSNPLRRTLNISAVAYDNGFASIAHFSKVFREHFGTTPSAYRASRLGLPPH